MEYSKIDKLGVNPSLLGFGCMRFPKKEDGTIDEVEAEKDDGWYCDSGCSGCVDISADQSTDIYQGPDQ